MERRKILEIVTLASTTIFIHPLLFANEIKNNVIARKSPLVLGFEQGVASATLPNGSWNLWVRAAPKGAQPPFVRLRLQVAEDEGFGTIIMQQSHLARKETSYILRTNISVETNQNPLFFRFVAIDTGLSDNPNFLIVSPTGELDEFRHY